MLKLKNITSFRPNITPAAKYLLTGLIIIFLSSFHSKKHPFYIGLTELVFNGKPEIQVTVRLFSNDLEDALRKSSGKPIDIINPKNKAQADSILFQYINKRLAITLNGKSERLHYLGYEKDDESIWTYMEIKQPKAAGIKTATIINTILYDYFPTQTHIVRIIHYDTVASYKITNPESKAEF